MLALIMQQPSTRILKTLHYCHPWKPKGASLSAPFSSVHPVLFPAVPKMAEATLSTKLESDLRVVITANAEDGSSVFASDKPVPQFRPFGPAGQSFRIIDRRESLPASNNPVDPQAPLPNYSETLPRCPQPGGVLFCMTDIPPGHAPPVHRTQTLDYAIVVSGEIVLVLDGGAEKTVRAGEFIVQGGASHAWHNRSQETCRLACVMVAAEVARRADGTAIEETKIELTETGGYRFKE